MLMSQESHTSYITELICSNCQNTFGIHQLQNFSDCCHKPLLVRTTGRPLDRNEVLLNQNSMWRYQELLPLFDQSNRVSLGEGMTPMIRAGSIAKSLDIQIVWLKDEGTNPTGSFKARGMSMAVSKAKELGVDKCVVPTAGNAGVALSAYCAKAGMDSLILMPSHTPKIFQDECRYYGSEVVLVDGLIDECGMMVTQFEANGYFNMSTLKEPYRVEGKKTMGFEIAEQLDWVLPDVIIYPTGGGTGLIGMWKAFQEMIHLGWLSPDHLPRMVVVQSSACAPMVDFINGNTDNAPYGESKANGLAVPKAFGEDLIKKIVIESKGYALTVTEEELVKNALQLARLEGLSISPEGGAALAGLKKSIEQSLISLDDSILIINTGGSQKYMDNFRF